jgi:hypothetical protein
MGLGSRGELVGSMLDVFGEHCINRDEDASGILVGCFQDDRDRRALMGPYVGMLAAKMAALRGGVLALSFILGCGGFQLLGMGLGGFL